MASYSVEVPTQKGERSFSSNSEEGSFHTEKSLQLVYFLVSMSVMDVKKEKKEIDAEKDEHVN